MEEPQLDLIEKASPEKIVRDNLIRAMIRHRGNIQEYYSELLKRIPEREDKRNIDFERLAAYRLLSNR